MKNKTISTIRGFTLIEILVASAVMVILVGIVAYIARSVLDSWSRASGKLSANAEARLVLDQVALDLETAYFSRNGQQWFRIEKSSFSADAPYSSIQSDSVILKLFAMKTDRIVEDDEIIYIPGLHAISYQLQYKETYNGGPRTYALYRMIESGQDTLEFYLSSKFSDPEMSAQGSLTSKTVTSSGAKVHTIWSSDESTGITRNGNYLATNIVSFKIIVYDEASNPLPANADAASNEIIGDYYAFGGVSDTNTPEPASQLIYADIVLTIVSDKGMELLENIERGLVSDDPDDVVTQHGETMVRRVYFDSTPI